MRPAIVLFCGNAARDEQQKHLPPRFLTRLHDSLLRRLRTRDADIYVATHDDREFRIGMDSGGGTAAAVHTVHTLGAQIDRALRHCFGAGHRRVLIVAGDAPIDMAIVQRALDTDSPVIAASRDGGFALAGFSALPSIDWDDVVADRAHAADALRARVRPEELPRVDDIDTLDDARRLRFGIPRDDFAPFAATPPFTDAVIRIADRAPPSF